jgi:hypothetical protein
MFLQIDETGRVIGMATNPFKDPQTGQPMPGWIAVKKDDDRLLKFQAREDAEKLEALGFQDEARQMRAKKLLNEQDEAFRKAALDGLKLLKKSDLSDLKDVKDVIFSIIAVLTK